MKKEVKIEFRCTKEERERVYRNADKQGVPVRDYFLNATIYKKGRSGLNTVQNAALCRIATSLNKIDNGVDVEEENRKIVEECKELCVFLKR